MTSQGGQVFKASNGKSWAYRYHDASGKRPFKSGFKSKGEARAALNVQLDRVRLGDLYRPDLTLREFSTLFLDRHDASQRTLDKLEWGLDLAATAMRDPLLRSLRTEDLLAWRKGLSPGARWDATRAIKQALRAARDWNYIDRDPAARIKNPQPQPKEFQPFAWEEVIALGLELPPHQRHLPVVVTGTGLRPGEWIALRWTDIDLDARILRVNRMYAEGVLQDYPKNKQRRAVPLRQVVVDGLRELRAESTGKGIVFPAIEGGYIELHNWRQRDWRPALEAAGVEHRRPYDMRHTYATMSLRQGISTFLVARRMGTSVAMIDRTYGHFAPDSAEYELGLLDAYDRDRFNAGPSQPM